MKRFTQKTALPILMGLALYGGTVMFYAPETAQAMPHTEIEEFSPEIVFAPQD